MRSPAYLALISTFAFTGVAAAQQTPSDSLVAAAHRSREERSQQPKATRIWDNDNIPMKPGEITVLNDNSPNTPASSDSSAPAGDASKPGSVKGSSSDKKAGLDADLAAAKENLLTLQNDLDILKRELALDQQSYYGKPNYIADKDGSAALSEEQDQIDAKQLEMGAAQQKIVDLQTQLNTLAEAKSTGK